MGLRIRFAVLFAALSFAITALCGAGAFLGLRSRAETSHDAELVERSTFVVAAAETEDGRLEFEMSESVREHLALRSPYRLYLLADRATKTIVAASDGAAEEPSLHAALHDAAARGGPAFGHAECQGRRVRIYALTALATVSNEAPGLAPAEIVVVVGEDVGRLDTIAQQAAVCGLSALGLGALLAALAGSWFASRVVAPLTRLANAAAAGEGMLEAVGKDRPHDEIRSLAVRLEGGFECLRHAVERERRFTTDAAHELRTPVSVVNAQCETILDRPRSAEEYRSALARCREAGARMESLIEALLALARAEQIPDDFADSNVAAVLERVVEDVRESAALRGVRIERRVDGRIRVAASEAELRIVLVNLLSNAVRHAAPSGVVVVEVRATGRGAEIAVVDDGDGLAPQDVPRVFDRFFRGDGHRAREAGGYGIGLALVKALVERRGGVAAAANAEGRGARFSVTLPSTADEPRG